MKSVISIALILFAGLQAEAVSMRVNDNTTLDEGSISITSVAGAVQRTTSLCPAGATCVLDGTMVDLTFTGGCVDQLLPVAYTVVGDEVVVHAQIVHNEKSLTAMCIAIPVFPARLQLINVYPPFKIRFMNTSVVTEVK